MLKQLFRKKLFTFLILVLLLFSGWVVYTAFSDKPPRFFPLNNPEAEYKVTKMCPQGQGWDENIQPKGDGYCIEYKGSDVFGDGRNTNFFRITVGNSKIDLEPLNGKNIKNIRGKYTDSSKQCIQEKCTYLVGPFIVLDIDSLEVEN